MIEPTLTDEKIADFFREVRNAPLSALLLDYDGTLAPFSLNRGQALPYAGVPIVLQDIVDAGRTRLVIVTGRTAGEVAPLLGIHPMPEVWGAHGLQRLRADGTCETPEIPQVVQEALDEARRWLSCQGLAEHAEIKPGSIAVHWRSFEETEAIDLRSRVLLGWDPIAARGPLELLEFDGGVEARISSRDKGDAVATILKEVGPHVPVAYLGDDLTDESAFKALGVRGLTVLVGPQPRATSAQSWLSAPEGLLKFLRSWSEAKCEVSSCGAAISY